MDPTRTALGTWSGGRFMRFGAELDHERLLALLRPDENVQTLITADVYGMGAADELAGEALAGLPRDSYCLVGAIGHDFYEGERQGAKGFPRFTDPALRGPAEYASYLRMATERSLERIGADSFDLVLLHNPDRTGYSSPVVWEQGMAALRDSGLTRLLGVAPGPANGFTLDMLECFERFGELIDWAMVILNPFEPWPSELVLPAARQAGIDIIARVADFGGIFHDDVRPGHRFLEYDHRTFRPEGWVEQANELLERVRPIAERHGLTMLQLAAFWNLAQDPVKSIVPTLIEEADSVKPAEAKRAELASLPNENPLTDDEIAEIRAIGDNTGCMALKGASPENDGQTVADSWPVSEELAEIARRWRIEPDRQLVNLMS
ncbi:MAG: aldo/keto reductase [Actinobacteria bacterium]|nr:aldo/keto reductase [Actinomycetota bacterium]